MSLELMIEMKLDNRGWWVQQWTKMMEKTHTKTVMINLLKWIPDRRDAMKENLMKFVWNGEIPMTRKMKKKIWLRCVYPYPKAHKAYGKRDQFTQIDHVEYM